MNATVKAASIEHALNEVANSLVESFIALNVLRALRDVARAKADVAMKHSNAHDEWYRASFDSLYARVGRVIDTSDDSFTLPYLINRLRKEWSADQAKLAQVELTAKGLADAHLGVVGRLKRWRHKAIAHRTKKATDIAYYEANKISIDEVEVSLLTLQALFNELSYMATETIHDCTDASPYLQSEVKSLFGLTD